MFRFLKRLWTGRRAAHGGTGAEAPALLDLIRAWDGKQEFDLPDGEMTGWDLGEIRFAGGALDGILLNQLVPPEDEESESRAEALVDAVEAVTVSLAEEDMESLYAMAREETLITAGDAILEALQAREAIDRERLWAVGKWLTETAAHREPLKLGIMILGLGATDEDIGNLKILARHDEFTLFAAVAIGNLCEEPADHWLELAGTVRGWGKIHLVERLAEAALRRADIRDWLLRKGCDNEVEDGYLAYLCATAGDLDGALTAESIDDELLDGACTIILSMIVGGGPSLDINGYAQGPVAVDHLLRHLEPRCHSIERLHAVVMIAEWLRWQRPAQAAAFPEEREEADEQTRQELLAMGWSDLLRGELIGRTERVLSAPEWAERLRAAYRAGAEPQSGLAIACAEVLGVDLWEIGFRRLAKAPHEQQLYYDLLRTNDARKREKIIAFAEANLPLERIGSGPALELGLGDDWDVRGCLDFVLQEIERRGPYSERLMVAAMRSPVIRHRLRACQILAAMEPEGWGPLVEGALNACLGDEPDEDVRGELESLGRRLTTGEP
ncbi:MAG: hypothetical protein ACTSUD_11120 [Alphaproteobacteria bacterium]